MTETIDPLWHRCSNTEFSQRCADLGTFTWATLGSEKWYCRKHFFPANPPYIFPRYDSIAILPDDQKKHDGKDWARRILHRKQSGESLPLLSLELAAQALGIKPREPGSDDE